MKIIAFIILMITSVCFADTAGLVDLQKLALSENPRIRAMQAEAQMVKKRIPQSNALDDPKIKLGVNNLPVSTFSFTSEDMTSVELGISQMIPLGKLFYKKRIAEKEYEKSELKLKAEKVELLHQLRMSVYELSYLRTSIKILEEIKRQYRLVIESEVAASKSGMGNLSNVIKVKIEHNMIDEETISLKQKTSEVEQKIYYLIGRKAQIRAEELQDPKFRDISVEAVQRETVASNLDLKMLALDAKISKDEISQKKSEYAPDMDIGINYGFRQSTPDMRRDDMISGMVTFSIPLWFWKKNVPMIEEMKKKNVSARNLYLDKTNDVKAKVEILVGQLNKWRDLYGLYRDRLIPQMELSLETNLARYRTSAVEFMPVVDTMRMLLKYKKDLAMVIKEYYAVYSELSALMGVEVLP